MRYLEPNGTAGLARFAVKGARREPCPPARIIPSVLGGMRQYMGEPALLSKGEGQR
jgi:hypothetical protein